MSEFKRVYQECEAHGCGAAVVAMIAGVSFKKAERVCGGHISNSKKHVGIQAISAALEEIPTSSWRCAQTTVPFRHKTRGAHLASLQKLGQPAVVRSRSIGGVYHWLFWTGEELWDPLPKGADKGGKGKSTKAGPTFEGAGFDLYKYREIEKKPTTSENV
ncbi:hypothetical protein [Brevirhabdus pacifica]|uniref:hypothetical protein n=1 Tax=Brevirhabdus pacifica TaxID=1267768 RepID=UPI00117EC27C|nr:hypothetical protein [Brevirhabdus pacifica]